MKLLLDENVPRKIKKDLFEFDVFSVQDMGWNGKQNDELLNLMLHEKFEALITTDKNLQHQQNFKKYPIPVIVLNVKLLTYDHIAPLVSKLKGGLKYNLKVGSTIISESRDAQ